MRVLLIHRYFWPDTPPYAQMLKHIAGALVDSGHDVHVLTAQPSYSAAAKEKKSPWRESVAGATVRRIWLFPESKQNFPARLANLAIFLARIAMHILFGKKYDVVMAATTPPVMVAWVACLTGKLRSSKFVYHCQDIHPEIMERTGIVNAGFLTGILRRLDHATVRRAERVVVLSTDMARTVRARGNFDAAKIVVLNNFVTVSASQPGPARAVDPSAPITVLFAGNIGYFQGLETVIDASALIPAEQARIVFLGDGAALTKLKEYAAQKQKARVEFLGRVSKEEADEFIFQSDICLVCLAPGIIDVAYPSKTLTYLAQGKPVIAVVEKDSDLASLIVEKQIGYVSAPGNASELNEIIQQVAVRRQDLNAMGARTLIVANEEFGQAERLRRWQEVFAELTA